MSYEGIAILCSTTLLTLLGNDPIRSLPLSIGTSIIAILWNMVWNTLFEYIEKRMGWKGRSVAVRVLHAVGFEGSLTMICIPLLAWWLNIPLLAALFTQVGLLAFFLFYTYVFNYSFDKLFGLPESAS